MNEQKTYDKIAYIVPSKKLRGLAEEALQEYIQEGWIDVMMIDQYDIPSEYHRLVDEGYGCLVARGGTYLDLTKLNPTVPVIEERIRTADILQQITDHFQRSDQKLCIILYQWIAYGCENLEKLSGGKIKMMRYDGIESLKEILESIRDEDVAVLTSGIAEALIQNPRYHLIEVRNRPVSIRITAQYARKMMVQMQNNVSRTNILNSIFNSVDEGLIIFRPDNQIERANRRALTLLGMPREEVLNQNIYDLIPNMPPRKNDGSCSVDSPARIMAETGSRRLSVALYPFQLRAGTTRYMAVVQDVTRIQESERKIRLQLAKKGLTAERRFEEIITREPAMEKTIERARRIAEFDGAVLISGESGTGKELFAQSIHNASSRRNGPFVAVNCGALTDSLLESELFGYVGGAFTGARKEGKEGLFELAHNGTIFLDEINSTSKNMQTKILRVIEEKRVMRVGSDYVIPLDIRVISASNSDLRQDMIDGKFRRDLFYRLNTFQLRIPSVRDRRRDIPLLFTYYLHILSPDMEVPEEFMRQLENYDWLGNVREIRSAAYRFYAFGGDNSNGDIVDFQASREVPAREGSKLEPDVSAESPAEEKKDGAVPLSDLSRTVEQIVIETLEKRGMTKSQIAETMGISRQALYRKLKK